MCSKQFKNPDIQLLALLCKRAKFVNGWLSLGKLNTVLFIGSLGCYLENTKEHLQIMI